jgi:hypothetical protein
VIVAIRIVRCAGTLLGVTALAYGASMLSGEPPTEAVSLYYLGVVGLLGFGILLALPWSRVRNGWLWLALLALYFVTTLGATAFLGSLLAWSSLRDKVGSIEYLLVIAATAVAVLQLPILPALRRHIKKARTMG